MMSAGEEVRSVVLTGYGGYECLKVSSECFQWWVAKVKGLGNMRCWWSLSAGEAMAYPSAWGRWCAGGRGRMWREFLRPVHPSGYVAGATATPCAGDRMRWGGDSCGGCRSTHQGEQTIYSAVYKCSLWFWQRKLPAALPSSSGTSALSFGDTRFELWPESDDEMGSFAWKKITKNLELPSFKPCSSCKTL